MNPSFLQSPALKLLTLILILLSIMLSLYIPYRRDIKKAYFTLSSLDRQIFNTSCGPIEVASRGQGEPVLVIHGISGGFDQGLGWAQAYLGDGYQIIAPSRFGYIGTPMPVNATPQNQAEAFVRLLDALKIEKATVVANSAGGTSAVQMALRYPERVKALVFVSTIAPTVGQPISLPPKPVIQIVFGSDFLMWIITTHLQSMMRPAVGVPEGYILSAEESKLVSGVIRSVLPVQLRTEGFVLDMFTSNLDMDRHPEQYPLENIAVPVLVIHALDDSLASYENAQALAARIPGAQLLSIPTGGHLLLGTNEIVRSKIAEFLQDGFREIEKTSAVSIHRQSIQNREEACVLSRL
jgi:pimeloyl-ACP methyl ester carboxylesterase